MTDNEDLIPIPGNASAMLPDLLPQREPIIGEDVARRDAFQNAIVDDLSPAKSYECILADRLAAIEWDLHQHRQMRNASVSRHMRYAIRAAVVRLKEAEYQSKMQEAAAAHLRAGRSLDVFKPPYEFNLPDAEKVGDTLAENAVIPDVKIRTAAEKLITQLGLKPIELMAEAYTSDNPLMIRLEEKIKDLERRAREVKRDFDALVKSCPLVQLYENRQTGR